MKSRNHLIFWLIYIIYALLVDYFSYPEFYLASFFGFLIVHHVYIFYSSLYFFKKFSLKGLKQTTKTTLRLISILSLYFLMRFLYIRYISPFLEEKTFTSIDVPKFIAVGVRYYFIFSFLSATLYFSSKSSNFGKKLLTAENEKLRLENNNLNLLKKNEELQNQKLEAENAALKAQINPHFLFNTLNFLFGKTLKIDKTIASAIHSLSTIMQASFKKPGNDGLINVLEEITILEELVQLYQYRFDNKLQVLFTKNIEWEQMRIVPHILITLVENAFKHGDLEDSNNPLTIEVTVTNQLFQFNICNRKSTGEKLSSHGIGLHYVKNRLQTTYGNKCTFIISDTPNTYTTQLSIAA